MAAVTTLPAMAQPLVSPLHRAKCQLAAALAVRTALLPAAHQLMAVTLPFPLVCAVKRYWVCHCQVSVALLVSASVTLVVAACE